MLEWLQAIGSEVAAETSRSADRKAPATTVAVSRAEISEANIFQNPFCISCLEPDHRVRANSNAWAVPIEKCRYISVDGERVGLFFAQNLPANW
jgi:hypothetical protein